MTVASPGGVGRSMVGPGGRPFTAEQAAAIQRRDGPLVLSANAGSGKTAVMVERFVRAVHEDGVDVADILAITFTEKAAAELRSRIRARFLELGDRDAARATERAHISTIHGFCSSLLTANAIAAGIDPEFRLLTEHELELLERVAFRSALGELLDAEPDAVDVAAAYRVDALQELVTTAYAKLRSRGETTPRLPAPPAAPDLAGPARELLDAARALESALVAGGRQLRTITAALDAVADCQTLLGGGRGAGDAVPTPTRLGTLKVPGARVKELNGEEGDAYRAALDRYRQACIDHHAHTAYRVIDALLARYGECYTRHKRERGALDFEDLELLAADLLDRDPGLRERVRERFAAVMVDEFQDTNWVQLRLLELLARDNLFAVGDEFQSIYGFRYADVAIIQKLSRELPHATLATNFRSRREILDALNVAFGGEDGVFEGRFTPLVAGRRDPAPAEDAEPAVEMLVTDTPAWTEEDASDAFDTPAWRVAEARLLARRIRSLLDEGIHRAGDVVVLLRATTDLQVYERALIDAGVPTYVLGGHGYWSHPQVRDATAYLALMANPLDGRRLFQVLASPLVGLSSDALVLLATAARSAQVEPWRIVHEPGAARLQPADRDRLDAFRERFEQHRAAAAREPLDALIDRIITDTGYDLAVLAMPGGDRRMANLRKLMRLAAEYEAAEEDGLRGFVDFVAALTEDPLAEAREGEAPVESEAVDAVRLMTIHRAKGLEYPVVCVADLGRVRPSNGRELLRLGDRGQVGLKLVMLDGTERCGAFAYEELGEAQEAEFDAEERRLFYVAMTRARERLILSGALDRTRLNGGRPPPMVWIARALAPDVVGSLSEDEPVQVVTREWEGRPVVIRCALNVPSTFETVAGEAPAGAAAAAVEAAEEEAAPSEQVGDQAAEPAAPPPPPSPPPAPVADALSYSRLQDYGRCGYRYYVQRVLGLPKVREQVPGPVAAGIDPLAPEGATLPATVRGTIVHELLERADFARPLVPSDDELVAACAAHGHEPSEVDIADLRELMANFAASDLPRRLDAFPDVRRETPFSFALDPEDPTSPVVNGIVDVVADGASRTLVVDYKSDRLGDADPETVTARDYSVQRLIYGLAALRSGADDVEVIHCYLERAAKPAIAHYVPSDAPRLAAELQSLAAGLLNGIYEVAAEPHFALCAGCPARAALCSWPAEMTGRETVDS